jgi:sugar phosphate isomerase/epimerase
MTFDFGHANTLGRVNSFLPYIKRASHIHIHDNHGTSDEHLALGDGLINWKNVSKSVAGNYNGIIVIEGRSMEEGKKSLPVFRKCFL